MHGPMTVNEQTLPPLPLPAGIRSRMVPNINGLTMHVLEAGFETPGRPTVLLLHGFPELAYSWRKVMPQLAQAGFHVIAPDQRGYGRTTGWDADYDGDLRSFSLLNLVRDALGLVSAFGLRSVAAVVGHDFGASVAAWCALVRPDVFRALTLDERAVRRPATNSVRHGQRARGREGAGSAFTRSWRRCRARESTISGSIRPAKPTPTCRTPRRACTRSCAPIITTRAPTGPDNKPFPLAAWTADELAKLPTYYVMELDKGMAATVAEHMPTAGANRRLQVAHRARACGLCRRIRAQRFSGRAAVVSLRHHRALHLRA